MITDYTIRFKRSEEVPSVVKIQFMVSWPKTLTQKLVRVAAAQSVKLLATGWTTEELEF
jgi:hypothetical protein